MNKVFEVFKSNRFKSFYWRTGMMATAGFIGVVLESSTELGLPAWSVILLGLVMGEISKYLNTN